MAYGILIVDDQRDIIRLLHSTLDTLKNGELQIYEAQSGEEAMLEVGQHKIDLLVVDYLLPGMNGIELMHKVRAKHPNVKVILVTGMSDRKAREEMLNAGAAAIFDKPIPLADFLDAVERSLGLVRTIFPSEAEVKAAEKHARIADLLANFRQDVQAQAVLLLNERGLVMARAGDFRDRSMEVSLVAALAAIFSAGLKVAKYNRQEGLQQYFASFGGDQDLLLVPVDASHSLLLAGQGLSEGERISESLDALRAVRDEIAKSLRSLGVTSEFASPPSPSAPPGGKETPPPAVEIEALLKEAGKKKVKPEDVDAFWDQAAQQHANKTTNPEVIPYEEARKMGLTPDQK